jgi:FtsZ-binding cell division protein ZapB
MAATNNNSSSRTDEQLVKSVNSAVERINLLQMLIPFLKDVQIMDKGMKRIDLQNGKEFVQLLETSLKASSIFYQNLYKFLAGTQTYDVERSKIILEVGQLLSDKDGIGIEEIVQFLEKKFRETQNLLLMESTLYSLSKRPKVVRS